MITTLYVDADITGPWLYHKKHEDPPEPATQPHLRRLAWLVDDGESDPLPEECHLIEVPAVLGGGGRISLAEAMRLFMTAVGGADRIVAFNWSHHRKVLEHCLSYRLSWPRPVWPEHGCAMIAARDLARAAEQRRSESHNMTDGSVHRTSSQFPSFEAAAAAQSYPLHPIGTLDPISAGYQRLWACRKIWTDFEGL